MRLSALLLSLALSATADAGLLRDGDPDRGLEPVPVPDTARLSPRVIETLEDAEAELDRVHGDDEGPVLGVAYGKLGMRYQSHQLNDAAGPAYRNAIRLDPGEFRWPYFLGFLHHEEGRFEQARRRYAEAIAMAPEAWEIRMRDALAALELGDLRSAEARLDSVLSQRPDEAAAIAALGEIAAERGDHATAVERFRRALELQPAADRLHYLLGLSLRRIGESDAAREQLARRGEVSPGFHDQYLSAMQGRAKSPAFYGERGMAAAEAGRLEEAAVLFELAVEIGPAEVPGRLSLGRTLIMLDRVREARPHLERAVELDPDNTLAVSSLGNLYEMTGRDEEALPHYRRLTQLEPGAPNHWRMLGNALMRLDRFSEAETAYRRMRRVSDDITDARLLIGLAQAGTDDCHGALATLRPAGESRDKDPATIMALARLLATCEGTDAADHQRAMHLAAALHRRWPSVETAATLAMALAALGRDDEAAELSRRALFEALRSGGSPESALVQHNLERIESGEGSLRAFGPGSPLMEPARVRP